MKKFIAKLLIVACLVTSVGPLPELRVKAATTQSTSVLNLVAGQKFQMEPQEDVMEWSSSHPGIVSVDDSGLVTAIVYDSRTVTITGTHYDGTTESYSFKVVQDIVSQYDKEVYVDQKRSEMISLRSGYGKITCSVDDPSIATATCSSSYLTVRGVKPGETIVRLHTDLGVFTVKVIVKDVFSFYNEETMLLRTVKGSYLELPDDFESYVWSNSNPEVLELKPYRQYKYEMVPKQTGTSVVTVTNELGQIATTVVNVFDIIPTLEFDSEYYTVFLGSTYQLPYTAFPSEEETNNKITFKATPNYSFDEGALEVTEDGLIIPYKTCHNYKIRMSALGSGSGYDTCYIDVVEPHFVDTYYSLKQDEKFDLNKILGRGDCEVIWSSENSDIVSVDKNGIATAVGNAPKGSTNITTITADCGGYEASIDIEVLKPYLSKTKASIYAGATTKLSLKRADSAKVKWTTSKKSVATVDKTGKVTGKKAGTATITATYNGRKYTCKVTVKGPELNYSKKSLIAKQTYTLKVKGATGKIKWSSSKKSVATVSSSGKITAKKAETAYIYAKVDGKTLKCKLTVKANKFTNKVNKDVYDYSYGTPQVVLHKAYWSGSKLKVEIYVMNNRMFRADKFTWLDYKIHDKNGKTIAKKRFKNIYLGIKPYSYKKITLTYSGSSIKNKKAILNEGVGHDWEFYYRYTY